MQKIQEMNAETSRRYTETEAHMYIQAFTLLDLVRVSVRTFVVARLAFVDGAIVFRIGKPRTQNAY